MTMDDILDALKKDDDTQKVAAGLIIGDLIAEIISKRNELRLSQADLAHKMNVPVRRIRRMEDLKGMPRIDTVIQALLVLGTGMETPTMMTPEIRVAIEKARVKIVEGGSDDMEDCNLISPDAEGRAARTFGERRDPQSRTETCGEKETMGVIFRGFNERQVMIDGDTLIIEADEPPEGYVPRFYCSVGGKEIDITEYVREETMEIEKEERQ